ncbi:hypothetical protein BGW42_007881, partial [Actinomortierella wolfii]
LSIRARPSLLSSRSLPCRCMESISLPGGVTLKKTTVHSMAWPPIRTSIQTL